jgi:hypothetical protein
MNLYAPRPIRYLGTWNPGGYAIKLYGITVGPAVDRADFEKALALAAEELPQPARTPQRPGAGFAVLHQGRDADSLVLGWWDRDTELPLRIFVLPAGEKAWREAWGSESIGVWDMQVMWFERGAYVATLLTAGPAALGAYLERHLDVGA